MLAKQEACTIQHHAGGRKSFNQSVQGQARLRPPSYCVPKRCSRQAWAAHEHPGYLPGTPAEALRGLHYECRVHSIEAPRKHALMHAEQHCMILRALHGTVLVS
eukprot:1153933-Pelagomonas_calceolata.AAC.12